ncbi:MAG: D-alanyl-D-alanine carboxypeptidase family protein [Christensenellales bacterium]
MKKNFFVGILLAAVILFGGVFVSGGGVFAEEALSCNAKAAIMMDSATGTVVYEKNAEEKLQIASMVKIMTLNLIFEEIEAGNLSYDDDIVASEYATGMGGSQAFLDTNSQYKASELIKSIIVASANDSCVAMAEHISGSVPVFVERMNAKAAELGMDKTYFVNCTGLPAPNQYSCAEDVSIMFRELIKHKGFFEFSKIWMFDFLHPSGRTTQLSNTNKLVRFYEGCDGGKTGFTSEALSCLSATAVRGETRLICVVMGAESSKVRNSEVSKLFNYGFANYETKKIVNSGDCIEETGVIKNGKQSEVRLVVKDDIVLFGKKGECKDCALERVIFDCSAPVRAGQKMGEIRVVRGDELLGSSDLLAENDVDAKGYMDIVDDIIEKW